MNLIEKYKSLLGQKISRKDLSKFHVELFDALPEDNPIIIAIWNKVGNVLYNNPDTTSFKIQSVSDPVALNGPSYKGKKVVGLDDCGRLQKGYKFLKGGKIVKVESKAVEDQSEISKLIAKFKKLAAKEKRDVDQPGKGEKTYKLGAMYSSDFDYYGMLNYASKISEKTTLKTLEKLYDSLEDVNYHSVGAPLWDAIVLLRKNTKDTGLKSRILKLKDTYGLNGSLTLPEITISPLNGALLADGHEILTDEDLQLYGEDAEDGLNASAKDVEVMVNELILEKIKTGEDLPPWKQTWANNSPLPAQNFVTKKEYTGSNSIILNILLGSLMPTPYYITANQIKSLGGEIKKGSKTVPLVYYNFVYRLKDLSSNPGAEQKLLSKIKGYAVKRRGKKNFVLNQGNYIGASISDKDVRILGLERSEYVSQGFLRYYRVFNIADTTGIDYELPTKENKTKVEKIATAEAIVSSFKDKPVIKTHKDKAFYRPGTDELYMPDINAFDNPEEYYSTLFHELIHATAHKSRLDRFEKYKNKESEAQYAFEELIAELGGSYLCGLAGILEATHLNQASYLKGWHTKLQKLTEANKDFFVFATREAQKAVDFIIKDYDDTKSTPPKSEDAEKAKRKAKAMAKAKAAKAALKLKLKLA